MASDPGRASRGVPLIWGSIPQRNKNFTGRDAILDQLRQDASGGVAAVLPHTVLPHALQGMGGVGKTALAIEYAHRYRADYDLVWWIPADQPPLVRSSLAALAAPLGLDPGTTLGIDGASSAVLDALRRGTPYSRWLLIFDNADQPEDLNEIIPRGPGDVLITSRNHRWQGVVDTVQVDVFDRTESMDFLLKRVRAGLNSSDASQLAEELGDLPLALEQAAALQAETGMPAEEYLKLLKDQVARIMEEGKPPEYPLSMTAAWRISVGKLGEQFPEAIDLLRCCAFFGAEPIPRDVFRGGTETRLTRLVDNPILLASVIRELGRFALVKIDGRAISVHRLVQALLRSAMDQAEQATYRHDVHLILAASAPADPDNNKVWPQYAALVPHVTSDITNLPACRQPAVRAVALEVVRYLYRSGDHPSARTLAERLIAQWELDSGIDAPPVLDAQRHLGNALRYLGRYADAYELNNITLGRTRRALGEQNPLTLALLNSFGADLRAHGDFLAARELDQESLHLHEQVFGPDNPQTWRVMNNLALDYGLNSDYRASRAQHERTYLQQYSGLSGASASEVLSSWNGLARAVRLCGNFAEARDVGGDAYDYGRVELGPDHYWTLRTAIDLSIALRRDATAYDEALELAAECYTRSLRRFDEGSPDTLAAGVALTNIQRTIGQTSEALNLAERTVDQYAGTYGPDHPYSRSCSGNLALLRRTMGDADAARVLDEAALAGLQARLGRNHHYSLTVAVNLASDLATLGDPEGARALGQSTLAELRTLLGEDHPLTLGCAANLVADFRACGADEDAAYLAADTMARFRRTLGIDHPDTVAAAEERRLDFDFDPPPI